VSHQPRPSRAGTADVALGLALLVGGTCYVAALPRVLGGSDEGIYLYEAKRLLDGSIFYRDVFDLITPGAHYLMAAAFALLGASIETARQVDAAMQGLITLATFVACRMLDVRRPLAVVAGLAQLTVFQPAWPVASPHWLATLLALVLLVVLLGRPDAAHGLVAGVAAGLLVAVQQQKGAVFTIAAAAFLLIERLLVARARGRIAAFAGGLLLVVVPLAVFLVMRAGVQPVMQALVLHPLVNYPHLNRTRWGAVGLFPWNARYTFPTLLAVAPSLAAVATLRTVVAAARGERGDGFRRMMLLAVMTLAAIGSVLYYPDYVHLAFIGSLFAVVAAELVEEIAARGRPVRLATAVLVLVLFGASTVQLERVMAGSWRDFPVALDTPFGRMDFRQGHELDVIERVRAVLSRSASNELFVYPFGAAFYLITGTSNPTPFQFLLPSYSRPDQLETAISILERHRVPYVIVIVPMSPDDPVLRYISSSYEQVVDDAGPLPLFRRRPE
jgi:hypothetical protein